MIEHAGPRVLIAGYHGYHNAGDEAILECMLRELREQLSRSTFTVISGDPEHTRQVHGVQAAPAHDVLAIVDAVRGADLVLLGGGGVLHDRWGLDPASLLTSRHSQIPFFAGPIVLAAAMGKPVALYAVGVGPLESLEAQVMVSELVRLADAVTVRDEHSERILHSLGSPTSPIHVTADPAWALDPADPRRVEKIWREEGLPAGPVLALALRHWTLGVVQDAWEAEVVAGVSLFAEEHDLAMLLLPFQTIQGEAEDDRVVARRVVERLGKGRAHCLSGEYSSGDLAGLIGRCELLVGMRLHSLIFAAITGTPAVALAYDSKVTELYRRLSLERFLLHLPELNRTRLLELMERAWQERERLAVTTRDVLPSMRRLAAANAPIVAGPLGARLRSGKNAATRLIGETLANAVVRAERGARSSALYQRQVAEYSQVIESLRAQADERERVIAGLNDRLDEQANSLGSVQARLSESEQTARSLDERLAARDEGIAWLRGEVDHAMGELRTIHASKWWRLASSYWAARERLRRLPHTVLHPASGTGRFARRLLPRRAKFRLKEFLARRRAAAISGSSAAVGRDLPVPPSGLVDVRRPPELIIQPALPEGVAERIVEQGLSLREVRHDVVCFSIIDWDFRFQRPQQLMAQMARDGHRVFYLKSTSFLHPDSSRKFRARELGPNLWEVELAARGVPDVYGRAIEGEQADLLLSGLDELRQTLRIEGAVAVVQVSAWARLALEARSRWGWRVVYDCMDDWESFPGHDPRNAEDELRLARGCDLLTVSGQLLKDKWEARGKPALLVRNGVDAEFYARRCVPNDLLGKLARPIVGYFGAIADWFDVDLMAHVASRRPDWNFVLLGGVFGVDVSRLRALANVHLLGDQPYETMPMYLYHFDACVIPFKVSPLTHATDPVKFYEYMAGGKPVVSAALAELGPYREHLGLARDREEFHSLLDEAVKESDPALAQKRRALAASNTWQERCRTLGEGIRRLYPLASTVVVTYNNLALTRLCLESLLARTGYPNLEVIVVDNASTDGTPEYLRRLAERHANVRILLNASNTGFARANNQGLREARGVYLALLNNDTVVPPGWLGRLLRHLGDSRIGLVGPVTNFAGNEARVDVPYTTWEGMESFAARRAREHAGSAFDIPVLAMYCVAFRRDVLERVGWLDERFEVGMFEDDDYTHRVRQAGYRVVCAEDAFVHHFGQAAFGELIRKGTYDRLFDANRRRLEAKWGIQWQPHRRRA